MTFSKTLQILSGIMLSMAVTACGGRKVASPEDVNTFRVETIAVDKVSVQTRDESNQPRKKLYNFSACLVDRVLEAPIKRTQFAVSDGKTEIMIKTDDLGCLLWTENHEVDSLQNEEIFEVTRYVIGKETYNGTVSVPLAFNPWNDSEALMDLRKQKPVKTPQKISNLEFGSKPVAFQTTTTSGPGNNGWRPWAYSDSVGLEFMDLDYANYKITDLLNLQVAQKFRVYFSPKILRRTLDGSYNFTPLASGQFRLRMTFLKSTASLTNPAPEDVIARTDSTLETRSDELASGYVTISFSDVALAASKMNVLVEISPIGSTGRYGPGYFMGQISPLKANSASINLEPRLDLETAALKLASAPVVQAKVSALEIFTKYSGFARLSNETQQSAVNNLLKSSDPRAFEYQTVRYLRGILNAQDKATYERTLCYKLFSNENISNSFEFNAMRSCFAAPKNALELSIKEISTAVTSAPKPVGVTREYSLSIANSFSFTDSVSTSRGTKLSAGIGLSAELGHSIGLFGGKISAGYESYFGIAKDKTLSGSISGSVSTAQSISAIANSFEFDVQSQRCLLVRPNQQNAQLVAAMTKVKADQTGYFLCDSQVLAKKTQQTYYFVNQSVGSSPFTDADSSASTKWRMTIRGDQQFEIFKSIVSNPNVIMEFEKYTGKIDGDQLPKEFMINQSFPGIL